MSAEVLQTLSETTTQELDPQLGYISAFGVWAGVAEPALRLLLTLFTGYPIAFFYRTTLLDYPVKHLHHLFFTICGLALCYFNYGLETYHSLIAVCVTYLSTVLVSSRVPQLYLTLNFVFNMGYLLLGYYFTASNEYDILWTMPQCILALRLIGFGFDICDGRKPQAQLSKDQKETALQEVPNLLELLAFAYFPSSFLVGPQYPFRRYKSFIDGEYNRYDGNFSAGIKRLLIGIIYLCICQIGNSHLPDAYFLSDEFRQVGFCKRLAYLGMWGKFTLYKYISCWLITEGALICFGLTFEGLDSDGVPKWSGCTNARLLRFETGRSMNDYVQSFNVNTNHWVASYIYKRLKFLNNRTISYGAALIFLAVWHGFHSGYYMAFLMEYIIVTTEKSIGNVYTKIVLPRYSYVINGSTLLMGVVMKAYNVIYMGWCLIPFVFLKYERWLGVMSAVNYFGFIYVLLAQALLYISKVLMQPESKVQIRTTAIAEHKAIKED